MERETPRRRRWLRRIEAVAAVVAVLGGGTTGCSSSHHEPPTRPAPHAAQDRIGAPTVLVAKSAPVGLSTPMRLRIPSIGVDTHLMALGLTTAGDLEVTPNGFPAGWYTGSPTPGQLGPAIIAGHVHWDGRSGDFYRLSQERPGARLAVRRKDGLTVVFTVTKVGDYSKARFPTGAVYGNIPRAGLRLITCGGFNQQTATYEDNIVVFAKLFGTRKP
jgi:sortase (surface protein transpeptidase)